MEKITVLIADDHQMARQALVFVINSDGRFLVIAECKSGEEAIEKSRQLQPAIVIMDINLPGSDGIEATGRIREFSPGSKILGISMHTQPSYAQSIMQKGALGYITKNSPRDEILKAILEVYEGRKYVCEEIKNISSGS
ncbi:MAG TPA: response regulator transcription factor [Chitinophagaceae bacterium]|jgi:two-component system invasion response regulator UvrY|nr:response regulator transcription factor [Chitinophagaceae bacterium]